MTVDFQSRVRGAVLGAAVGDAMGAPTEFLRSFAAIHAKYPPGGVTKYERYWDREGKRFAPYTDDTQMAELVMRALLFGRDNDADLDRTMRYLAKLFVVWAYHPQGGHRAPGNACLFGSRMLSAGTPWYEGGAEDAGGCGSVMRAYPFGILFAEDEARAVDWAVQHSKLTHRAPIAFAACAAMAVGMVRSLRDACVEETVRAMSDAARAHDAGTADMIDRAYREAVEGVPPEVTLERLLGWAAHEAIAASVYIFARHPQDFRAAILEAANTPGDSDSLGTLVGALLGARLGVDAIPEEWIRDLERNDELAALADQASSRAK